MMIQRIDMSGRTFGRLTVVKFLELDRFGHARWICSCSCGTEKVVSGGHLRRGAVKSCGCLNSEVATRRHYKHGHGSRKSGLSAEWLTWRAMRGRCKAHPHYTALKIKVCARWNSFENFLSDMGQKPFPGASIDRLDGSKGYYPGNCRWASKSEQMINRRSTRWITFQGQTKALAEWATHLGISASALTRRFKLGWAVEKAFTQPIKGKS